MKLTAIMANALRELEDRIRTERSIPAWLEKQVMAVEMYQDDPERALALLADGLQDAIDNIKDTM